MSKISIRQANEEDLPQIVSIGENIFSQEYKSSSRQRSLDFFNSVLTAPFDRMYVAHQEENVFGFAVYKPQGLTETHELFQIGIKKVLQGKGVGTALLTGSLDQYVKEMQKLVGVYAVFLATSFDNPAGQNLYKKCGFEVTGEIRDTWVGIGDKQIIMTKIFGKDKNYQPGTLWNPNNKK